MHSFATLITASALLSLTAGTPIPELVTRNMCGSAPSGSTFQAVLAHPTGIETAAACQAQCDANSQCQSFVFGMVNSVIECELFSCAASAVPTQLSANLLVYDMACSSVPAVVPTTADPSGTQSTSSNNNNGAGSNTSKTPAKLAIRQTCGGAPTGNANNAPIKTENAATAQDCEVKCKADPNCKR